MKKFLLNFSFAGFHKLFILTLLFFLSNNALGQLIMIPLEQRIAKADIVFEGKVIGKNCFWNESHTRIFTSNIVSVYKVFKGNLTSTQVEIITQGGIVGSTMEKITHTLELNEGDTGIFTAIPNTAKFSQKSNLIRLKAYAGLQGFIKYDLKNHTARDPFTQYKSISADVYPAIITLTKSSITIIKEADYKIQ
jgi:hypothetical protein